MLVYYNKNGVSEEIEVNNFYYDIACKIKNEPLSKNIDEIKISTDDGSVEYQIKSRNNTQFICEVHNSLPDKYLDKNIKDKFLTCVIPEKNAYKFYKLSILNNKVKASYGRMGTAKGELFGERTYEYPLSMFWIKYFEKIGKGYIDRTEYYLDSEKVTKKNLKQSRKSKNSLNNPSFNLFSTLQEYSKKTVKKAKIQVPITEAIIDKSKELVNKMRQSKSVNEFNNNLMELIAILQRPIRTGNGSGVKEIMASSKSDFGSIITRETDLIAAMEGSDIAISVNDDFSKYGIEVYYATESQKKQVISHLSDTLKPKVKNVYRVIPKEQQKRFNDYLKEHNISKVKQLWHGSRNENWISIIKNSLLLNPDAIITGKMFGSGIYFAPSSMKSWNYTSYNGSYYAKGTDKKAFMGLYAIAYGSPYDVQVWSSAEDYKNSTLKNGYNCLHAHAGTSLLNDEIVLYNEAAIVLNYIVEFE